MSEIDSREYKTLLRVGRFADRAEGVDDFLQHAQSRQVTFKGEMDKEKHRLVWYRDTEGFDLRSIHRITFRERWKLKNGELEQVKKVSVKFRSDDLRKAAEKDLAAVSGEKRKSKLEEDVVLKLDDTGGACLRVQFSKSTSTEVQADTSFERLSGIAAVFPQLGQLGLDDTTTPKVSDFVAHEVKIEGASVLLAPDCRAKASFTLWYEAPDDLDAGFASGELRVAEFSFSFKIEKCSLAEHDERAKRLLKDLGAADWMDSEGRTKTQVAYEGAC